MTDMYVHRYEKEMDGNQFWRDIIKNTLKIVNTIFKKNQPQQNNVSCSLMVTSRAKSSIIEMLTHLKSLLEKTSYLHHGFLVFNY